MRILLAETLDKSVEEVILLHLKNVERQSGGDTEKSEHCNDEKIFGFQHQLFLPDLQLAGIQ